MHFTTMQSIIADYTFILGLFVIIAFLWLQ